MNVVIVVAPVNFRAEELEGPRQELESLRHRVTIASTRRGRCTATPRGDAEATVALSEVDPSAFDAAIFVGGPGARVFFDDPDAHRLAKAMHEQHKVLGAICIAPTILARAGVLQGVRATAFPSELPGLEAAGAHLTADEVVTDGLCVTARGPEQAARFGARIAAVLELTARGASGTAKRRPDAPVAAHR